MGAEVRERRRGRPLVDREVAAVEAGVPEGPGFEPVVDGVVDDTGDVVEQAAAEEQVEEGADLDDRKRRDRDGPRPRPRSTLEGPVQGT